MAKKAIGGRVAVLGAGLAGCAAALDAAQQGLHVDLFEKLPHPVRAASLHNEGKLHLGYVYAADPERATHRILAEGSLRFLADIEALTGVPATLAPVSRPFHYAVPRDSLVTPSEVEAHFASVDATVMDLLREGAPYPIAYSPARRVMPVDIGVAEPYVLAAFKTSEVALQTGWIADVVGAAVLASSQIRFYGGHHIRSAALASDRVKLEWDSADGPGSNDYDGVVNALWQDRARLDAELGLEVPVDQWLRYKAAMEIHQLTPATVKQLPSLTLITGPYGDLVNHSNGTAYISWYPSCKLAEASGLDAASLEGVLGAVDRSAMFQESIEALARYVPAASDLLSRSANTRVGGGIIVARGKSDIDVIESGLHRRSDIGVHDHGLWVSIDTGKYCTAPWFGREAAATLVNRLAG
ncbi:FAD-dependent oxidoreductase [Maricaulaceae bacterium EIL42A08]|nr:FAD-dependent oxidoreductase [Maricaulaceae bacterium EIL42A08]